MVVGADLSQATLSSAHNRQEQPLDEQGPTPTAMFNGAMEELYFKNASAEHRKAYLYVVVASSWEVVLAQCMVRESTCAAHRNI